MLEKLSSAGSLRGQQRQS
jgi:hypothetical protein